MRIAWLAVLALICSLASAQPVSKTFPTLEAYLCRADASFTGIITKVEAHVVSPKEERPPGYIAYEFPVGYTAYSLTVAVQENLKGTSPKKMILKMDGLGGDERYTDWCKHKTRFLFFTGPGDHEAWQELRYFVHVGDETKASIGWSMIRLDPMVSAENYSRSQQGLPLLSSDLTLLRTPEAVVERTKAFVARKLGKIDVLHLELSGRLPRDPSLTGFGGMMCAVLPKSPELEQQGRQMVQNPILKGTPKERETQRQFQVISGIGILENFPSKANIDVLRPLLNDMAVWGYTRPGPIGNAMSGHEYIIRRKAYEAMVKMGAKVPKPQLEAPKPN